MTSDAKTGDGSDDMFPAIGLAWLAPVKAFRYLYRDRAVEPGIPGSINFAHTADAEP